jgi:hypothetical protein
MGGLHAEKTPVPVGVVRETHIFDLEIGLPSFPLRHPGEMHQINLPAKLVKFGLPKSCNLDLVWIGKDGSEHPASRQITTSLKLALPGRRSKAGTAASRDREAPLAA